MYAEAKLLMEKELSAGVNCSRTCECCSCVNLRSRRQTDAQDKSSETGLSCLEEQINLRAASEARLFLSSLAENERGDSKLSFQKVFLVLKFSETPEEVLFEGLKLMGDSEKTRSYFLKLAKLLHPDKNGHPLANQVF